MDSCIKLLNESDKLIVLLNLIFLILCCEQSFILLPKFSQPVDYRQR